MKETTKFKRTAVAACAVAAGLFAHAATEKTSYWAWNETKQAVVEQAQVNATVLDQSMLTRGGETRLGSSWYVVKGEVNVNPDDYGNIIVEDNETLNLILADGAHLNLRDRSLIVNKGSTLNIYGQKLNTGKLTIDRYLKGGSPSRSFDAAIGGAEGQPNGAINIHGGVITTKGYYGAGIGAGGAANAEDLPDQEGPINFYGGVVKAFSIWGAGIGGGSNSTGEDTAGCGNGGVVRTYGGVVVGYSSGQGSGIGGGCNGNGCDFHADGACIVGITDGAWDSQIDPRHGIGRGFGGTHDGTNTVGKSIEINYAIKRGDTSDTWKDMTPADFENGAKTPGTLNDDVYYFSWKYNIGINPAPHLDVSYSLLQMDGTEGAANKVEVKRFVTAQTFYGLTNGSIGGPENVGISNGVHVVYACQSGYTFPDGKKTRDLWIAPSRIRENLNLEVGGVGPYDLPAPVAEKVYYKLSMPDVEDASWTVTTNGVKMTGDLAKILKGTAVTVTWTARPGYVITSGATETFIMTADRTAKAPVVEKGGSGSSDGLHPAAVAAITVGTVAAVGVGGHFIGRAVSEAIGQKKGYPTYKLVKQMTLSVPDFDAQGYTYKNKLVYHPAKGTLTGRVVLEVQKGKRTAKIRAKAKGAYQEDGTFVGTLDAKGLGTFDFTLE